MELEIQRDSLLKRRVSPGTREFLHAGEQARFESDKDDPRMADIYKDGSLSYSINSLGYRTGEIEQYRDNSFVLVFGCSYTEGVALHNEDIWHSHITKKTRLPIMNLGLGGTGGEVIRLNSIQYVANNLPKPKLVIFQWPGDHRKLFAGYADNIINPHTPHIEEDPEPHIADRMPWTKYDTEWYRNRYVAYPNECVQTVYQNYIISNTVFNSIGVPTYNWQYFADRIDNDLMDYKQLALVNVTGRTEPIARDLMHPGKNCQLNSYEQIKNDILELL